MPRRRCARATWRSWHRNWRRAKRALREQDAELAQRAARITLLEQQAVTLNGSLTERDTQLRDGRRDAQALQVNLQRVQAQLESSAERVRALSAVAEQHNTTESQRKTELSRLLTERVELTAALEAARDSASAASARAAELEGASSQLRSRAAELEGALAGEHKRAAELEEELGTLRREMEAWGDALKSVHRERDSYQSSIAAAEARAAEAERRLAEEHDELSAVQTAARDSAARVRELEADLAAAEESLHRLEAEARKSGARVEELEKANQQWRATIEEARHSVTDTNLNALLREAARGGEVPERARACPCPTGRCGSLSTASRAVRSCTCSAARPASGARPTTICRSTPSSSAATTR